MDSLPVSDIYTALALVMLWFCSIEPSLGKIQSLSADSCNHIREVLATDCTNLPNSGVYWVQDMQVLNEFA